MRLTILIAAAATLALGAERPNLSGTWQDGSSGETLSIHQTDDGVEIAESGKTGTDVHCNTTGQACKVKGGEVSMWYNGDSLIIMETMHGNSRVIKKRLTASEDGNQLEEEIVHIEPAGSTEKLTLARRSGS